MTQLKNFDWRTFFVDERLDKTWQPQKKFVADRQVLLQHQHSRRAWLIKIAVDETLVAEER